MSTKQIRYLEPDAILTRRMLDGARRLNPGEELQVSGVPEARQLGFYQQTYDYVFLNLEDYGEFEQFPTSDGLTLRRVS